MARTAKSRRRKKRPKLEDRFAQLLDALLRGVGRIAATLLGWVASALRSFGAWLITGTWGTRTITAAVVALLVVGYYRYVSDLSPDLETVWTDNNVEALARVIRSEVGHSSTVHRIHVAWATRNLASERGQSVAEMACSPCGRQERGRPVSSRMAPRESDRILAQHILDQPGEFDPTGGATHFINPVAQDLLAESGRVPGYKGRTYKSVRRRWMSSYGWEPYYRLGPELELWGNKRERKRRAER